MLTDDYLIRIISIAIRALLRILGLIKSGQLQDAQQLIDLTISQLVGLNAGAVKNLPDEQVYDLMTRNDQLDTERLGLLADLFEQEGNIFAAQDKPAEAEDDYRRALRYNLVVLFTGKDQHQPDTQKKINALFTKLNIEKLDSETLFSLANYFEESQAFGEEEKVLLRLAERPEILEAVAPEIGDFYTRLAGLKPSELAESGFTPAQVQAGLQKWQH